MDLKWSAADTAFRDEVRGFLDEKADAGAAPGGPTHDERVRRA